AEALDRQEPFVNQTLAQHALALLTRLFRYGRIDHHGAFVNVAQNRVQPLAISPTLWSNMRRRGRRFFKNVAPERLSRPGLRGHLYPSRSGQMREAIPGGR